MPATILRPLGWLACLLILALMAQGIYSPRGVLLDFANFYDAGQKARLGEFAALYDPHALIGGKEPYGNMTFFSAPLTSYLYAPMASLSPPVATILFKTLGTLAQGLGLVLLYRHARKLAGVSAQDRACFFGLFAGAALLFQPFWVIYAVGGQTTPFVFLALVLAYLAYLDGKFVVVALLMSFVVVIKPAFVPAAILLFFVSSASFRVTAILCGVAVGAVSVWLFGLVLHQEFLARVLEETRYAAPPWMNSNPLTWIEPLFLPPEAYSANTLLPDAARRIVGGLRILAAVGLIWGMVQQRGSGIAVKAARHSVFVTALALIVVISPVVWSHYLVVLFIPLSVLIALRRHLSWWSWAAIVAAVVAALGQNLILLQRLVRIVVMDSTPKILALSVMKSLPALLIIGVLLLAQRSIGRALHDPAWRGL